MSAERTDFEGKVALVTGAGRGIGRATALALAGAGARVMGVSRTEHELAEVARTGGIRYVVESIATRDGCRRIVEATHDQLGPVDILVNNAGIGSYRDRLFWELDPAYFDEVMAVNLYGPFHLTQLVIPDMIERRQGRIVIVASTAGELAWPSMSAYCTSKHAVMGLMRSVAQDVAPYNVTCNAVLPGWVRTAMSEKRALLEAERRGIPVDDVWAAWAEEYPAGRIVTPEEVAGLIVFLSGETSSGITGDGVTIALGLS